MRIGRSRARKLACLDAGLALAQLEVADVALVAQKRRCRLVGAGIARDELVLDPEQGCADRTADEAGAARIGHRHHDRALLARRNSSSTEPIGPSDRTSHTRSPEVSVARTVRSAPEAGHVGILHELRADQAAGIDQPERAAVAGRFADPLGADHAPGTLDVGDRDLGTQRRLEMGLDQPRVDVVAAPRAERHDPGDGLAGERRARRRGVGDATRDRPDGGDSRQKTAPEPGGCKVFRDHDFLPTRNVRGDLGLSRVRCQSVCRQLG